VAGAGDLLALASTRTGCVNVYTAAQDANALAIMGRMPDCAPRAPVVTTGSATAMGRNGAVLGGTVDPDAAATTYVFQYGPTDSYGYQTATQSLNANAGTTPVTATLDGLANGGTYHYRVVATNVTGTTAGADMTFTTPGKDRLTPLGLTLSARGKAAAAELAAAKRRGGSTAYTFQGVLRLPPGAPQKSACQGIVNIQIRVVKQTISNRATHLQGTCSYKLGVKFVLPRRFFNAKKLEVRAVFLGNESVKGITSQTITIKR
jgi:hypothetical protein